MEKQSTAFILRLYFAVVSTITLFTMMFAGVELLTIGLKTYVITAADQPDWIESCTGTGGLKQTAEPVAVVDGEDAPTEEELKAQCADRNANSLENYKRTKASNAVRNLAMLIVAVPLFVVHFRVLYRDWMALHKE
ncbi:MAG: hypothetical protein AAB337_03160 [Patescibacteria group bacterium]